MFDSYNFTFNSLGSIGAIVLLNYITIPHLEKTSIAAVNYFSTFGIIFITYQYILHYNTTRTLGILKPTPKSI